MKKEKVEFEDRGHPTMKWKVDTEEPVKPSTIVWRIVEARIPHHHLPLDVQRAIFVLWVYLLIKINTVLLLRCGDI